MNGRRVLVCGGRDFTDRSAVWEALDQTDRLRGPIATIIHGDAPGADRLAKEWAIHRGMNGIGIVAFPANWEAEGRAAGPIRNARMIRDGRPDLVVAFPGGSGTADMVRRARDSGIEVVSVPVARIMNESAVVAAARAFRAADAALKTHIAGRREALSLPDKAWRAERVRLTEDVARTRIALHDAALK